MMTAEAPPPPLQMEAQPLQKIYIVEIVRFLGYKEKKNIQQIINRLKNSLK